MMRQFLNLSKAILKGMAATMLCPVLATGQSTPPNVVFIVADDLNTSLGVYGSPTQTPNLDALAGNGVRFDRVFAQYPVCGPARAAMMTGLYPAATGSLSNATSDFRNRHPDITALPQLFRQNGYTTARVSKVYHMGVPGDILQGTSGIDDPLSWDTAIDIQGPEQNALGPSEDLSPLVNSPGVDFNKVESTQGAEAHADGMAATEAVNWLRQRDTDKPFFLAVGMVRPHVPLVAPQEYFDLYPPESIELPIVPPGDLDDIPTPAKTQTNAVKYGMNEEQQKKTIAAYRATVSFMDAQVGRVLDELDAQGLTDNTIIVFTSDHGYNLGEHTTWQKLSLFEDTLRVPLIISAPGADSNIASSGVIEQIDLYPTLAELAGLNTPAYLHGQSFAELLTNPEAEEWQEEVSYTVTRFGGESLRTSEWRYNLWPNGDQELYDQVNDPGEFTNLANDPAYANVVAELNQVLLAKRAESLTFDMSLAFGDLNGDGVVDASDWNLFRPNILADLSGLTSEQAFGLGDFNRDGRIDGGDFAIFKNAFEAQQGAGSFASLVNPVPEPHSVLLVGLSLLLVMYRDGLAAVGH